MADLCGLCEEAFGERPQTQLVCTHRFHTDCMFARIAAEETLATLHCTTCENPMFPGEEGEEEEEEDAESVHTEETIGARRTRVLTLYNTNRTFRRDMKTYVHAISSMSKPRNEFQALLRRTKAELKEPYALIKARYEGLYNTRKDQLIHSAEYIAYKKAFQRTQRLFSNLRTNYRVFSYHLPALTTVPGLKRLRGRFGPRPFRLIQRALRLRLPSF